MSNSNPNLFSILQQLPADTVLWQVGQQRRTVRELLAKRRPSLAGKTVLLAMDDVEQLATALIALDGFVAAMIIGETHDQITPDSTLTEFLSEEPGHNPSQMTETRWILSTSGTTGTPKLVSHTLASLTRSLPIQANRGFRWGLLYDLRRFTGLQVFLRSVLNGETLVLVDRVQPFETQIQTLIAANCNALSATPTLWRKLLMIPLARQLNLRQITLGGEIVDQAILDALQQIYPQARLTHIYGSTEAGVGFSVHDGKAGFPVTYCEQPQNGAELSVDDNGYLHLRTRQPAQLLHNDEMQSPDGWINSGDLVARDGDRYKFLGRANGAINVGGNKVFPEMVERTILQVKGVQQVRVQGRRSSFMGQLVEAIVVPDDEHPDLIESIRQHCQKNLQPFQVPAIIHIQSQLDIDQSGKLARRENA